LWALGYPDQALARARQAIGIGREIQHPMSLSFALHHCVTMMLHARLWAEAAPLADEALRIATEQGFALWIGSSTYHRGICQFHLGDPAGIGPMRQGLEAFAATGARLVVPSYYAMLAEAHLQTGDFATAARELDDAFRTAAEYSDQNQYLAELHRLRGELLRAQSPGQPAEAEACFQQARAVARAQQAKSFELRATLSLCRLWQQQGRRADARQELDSIFGWFTEGFNSPDLGAAKSLLQHLSE
jgi:predicted ATPase